MTSPSLLSDPPGRSAASLLAPFLPRLVIDWLDRHADDPALEVVGSVAFVDISGFTKLSERLARQGKVGAEQLTETIGECFSQLLAVAYANGGGLLKFGGDALLLLFTGEAHELRSSAAAVGMRRALRQMGRLDVDGQGVALRMSVGVHSGQFNFFLVGQSHREFIVTGPAASTTVVMEATAQAGEIVVSPQTAQALRPGLLGPTKGPGQLLRKAPAIAEVGFPDQSPPAGADLAGYLPVLIRASLLDGGQRAPEHRRVTVAFIHFDEIDQVIAGQGMHEAATQLDELVSTVQRAVDPQGIAFLGTDIDRDGGKIILTAGAPLATGDDERRMLVALREIFDAGVELPLRAGVNRGDVFAGDIGPSYRRTFTVMGDTVNLAARLMAKATAGQILASEGVIQRGRGLFEATALEPFMVKGKARPVQALALGQAAAASSGDADTHPLVGRSAELQVLLSAVAAAGEGRGGLIELVGDPGVGKSRLTAELRRLVPDVVHLAVTCEPYASSIPYAALGGLLREVLGVGRTGDEAAADGLAASLRSLDGGLEAWAPLVAAALGVPMAETTETAQLEERFRRPKLAEVVGRALSRRLGTPTVLCLEDTHWMDEASGELLEHLAGIVAERPWLICMTRRPSAEGFAAPVENATSIQLSPLSPEETATLLRAATEEAPLSPHQLQALAERSGGNPLFIHELVLAAKKAPNLDVLPDTVEALITSRIDQLAPAERNLLRRVSVLGRRFAVTLVGAVTDEAPDEGTWAALSQFLVDEGDGTMSFRHGLARDGAYEALPYRLRRELHARVGDALRLAAGPNPDEAAGLLSVHYLHAQRFAEAWSSAMVAARAAAGVYANPEAAEFYERAITAAAHLPEVTSDEVAAAYEALGDVRHRVGDYSRSEAAYRASRRLVRSQPLPEARLLLKLSWVQGWLDRYSRALRWITMGLRTLDGHPGQAAARQRAQLLAWYGRFCQEQGRHALAQRWCREAIGVAEGSGDAEALAHALRVMDWAEMDLGRLDEPDNLRRALELYRDLGDLPGQASVLNMLGGFAYWRGDWAAAMDLYGQAAETLRRSGNTVMHAFCTSNIAEIALDQGRLDEAAELFADASRIWQAAGYRSGVAFVRGHQARVASRRGHYDEAVQLLVTATAELRDVGAGVDVLEATARLAECHAAHGHPAEALAAVDDALEQARALGGLAPQAPLLHRTRGLALLDAGDLEGSRAALEESLTAARTRRADFEEALSLELMASLLARSQPPGWPGPDEAEELRQRSRAIFERLGVVATPVASTT